MLKSMLSANTSSFKTSSKRLKSDMKRCPKSLFPNSTTINRRMEFSFHLHLPTSSWDETTRTIREEHPKACLFCAQIEADLRLLNRIITEDITGRLTMGDMIAQTAKDNNQMNFLTCK